LGSGGIDPVPAVGEEVGEPLTEGVAREGVPVAVGLLEGGGVGPALRTVTAALLGLRGGLALVHRAASWKVPMSTMVSIREAAPLEHRPLTISAGMELKRLASCQGCG